MPFIRFPTQLPNIHLARALSRLLVPNGFPRVYRSVSAAAAPLVKDNTSLCVAFAGS
jgi:hypothetical protein